MKGFLLVLGSLIFNIQHFVQCPQLGPINAFSTPVEQSPRQTQ
jgi:hypothetical protein